MTTSPLILRLAGMAARISRRERNGLTLRGGRGFTLIEIIVALVLVGIMAVMGGMVVVRVFEGYVATRDNAVAAQKAELAMSRISQEIIEMLNLHADATATLLPINNINGRRIIGLDTGEIKMAFGNETLAAGATLIDNVAAFTLTYYAGATPHANWPVTNDITSLTAIDITLVLLRSDGQQLPFTNRVVPRNNKNQGGAAPATPPPTAPQYGLQCFIAQAAHENPHHLAVQILRDFRDSFLTKSLWGRWVTARYYEHSPSLASAISGKEGRKWAARILLFPLVALAFFLLYLPWALLALPLTALLFYRLLLGASREKAKGASRGSVLIGLILTMLVMSSLAAAVLPLSSAAWVGQVYADQGRRAYFVAESGFRWAASQFLNAGTEEAKEAALVGINNKTCTLLDNAGSFTIRIFPYWFKTQAAAAGATTLSALVSGSLPSEFTGNFPGGRLRVGNTYYSFTSGSGSGSIATFTGLSPAIATAIPATPPLSVQPVAQVSTAQSLAKGGNLTIETGAARFFPALNGNFVLDPAPVGIQGGAVFNYTRKMGGELQNVTLADGTQNLNWTTSVPVTAGARAVLDRFIHLTSTGTVGTLAKAINYNIPVGWIAGGGEEFIKSQDVDHMASATGWTAPAGGGGGTQSIQTIDGGTALRVDSAPSMGGGAGAWAMTFFRGYVNVNLAKAWLDAHGFLSYDLQVKVHNTGPTFFAGINFRARNNADLTDIFYYGVSFVRPAQSRFCLLGACTAWALTSDTAAALLPDYVSDAAAGPLFSNPGLFQNLEQTSQPLWGNQFRYGRPAIILWERTAAGFRWLAYRTLTSADGVVFAPASPANALRLTNWSTLMVRVAEGFSLNFDLGGGLSGTGSPIKEGDIIETADRTSSARVVMTPVLTSGSWAARTAAGRLVLANIKTGTTPIAVNTPLFVSGVQRARATGTIEATKRNYLRVYYSRPTTQGTANAIQTDNNRLANSRNSVNWPPDDLTDLTAANDFVTIVQWTAVNTGVTRLTSTSEPNAIIMDNDLVSPNWTTTSTLSDFLFAAPSSFRGSGDSIGLTTSSGGATATSYDDFAIQLDQRAGTGFLPPIQQ